MNRSFLLVFGLACLLLAVLALLSGALLVSLCGFGFSVVFLALRRIIDHNQNMALLPRSALWLLRVLFLGSAVVFVGFIGFSVYALAMGISDLVRFHTPDNLGFGIGLGLFAIGVVPSFLVTLFTGQALWRDRKERVRGNAA